MLPVTIQSSQNGTVGILERTSSQIGQSVTGHSLASSSTQAERDETRCMRWVGWEGRRIDFLHLINL